MGSFALGQGILATPLQVLVTYNTLANGGVRVPPTLVRNQRSGPMGRTIPIGAGRAGESRVGAHRLSR